MHILYWLAHQKLIQRSKYLASRQTIRLYNINTRILLTTNKQFYQDLVNGKSSIKVSLCLDYLILTNRKVYSLTCFKETVTTSSNLPSSLIWVTLNTLKHVKYQLFLLFVTGQLPNLILSLSLLLCTLEFLAFCTN